MEITDILNRALVVVVVGGLGLVSGVFVAVLGGVYIATRAALQSLDDDEDDEYEDA